MKPKFEYMGDPIDQSAKRFIEEWKDSTTEVAPTRFNRHVYWYALRHPWEDLRDRIAVIGGLPHTLERFKDHGFPMEAGQSHSLIWGSKAWVINDHPDTPGWRFLRERAEDEAITPSEIDALPSGWRIEPDDDQSYQELILPNSSELEPAEVVPPVWGTEIED